MHAHATLALATLLALSACDGAAPDDPSPDDTDASTTDDTDPAATDDTDDPAPTSACEVTGDVVIRLRPDADDWTFTSNLLDLRPLGGPLITTFAATVDAPQALDLAPGDVVAVVVDLRTDVVLSRRDAFAGMWVASGSGVAGLLFGNGAPATVVTDAGDLADTQGSTGHEEGTNDVVFQAWAQLDDPADGAAVGCFGTTLTIPASYVPPFAETPTAITDDDSFRFDQIAIVVSEAGDQTAQPNPLSAP